MKGRNSGGAREKNSANRKHANKTATTASRESPRPTLPRLLSSSWSAGISQKAFGIAFASLIEGSETYHHFDDCGETLRSWRRLLLASIGLGPTHRQR